MSEHSNLSKILKWNLKFYSFSDEVFRVDEFFTFPATKSINRKRFASASVIRMITIDIVPDMKITLIPRFIHVKVIKYLTFIFHAVYYTELLLSVTFCRITNG